jgi:hypothetical protein
VREEGLARSFSAWKAVILKKIPFWFWMLFPKPKPTKGSRENVYHTGMEDTELAEYLKCKCDTQAAE